MQQHGKQLRDLRERLDRRVLTLEAVRRELPPRLATQVVSAGLEHGRLTLGVNGAVWASRLRYSTGALRTAVGAALGTEVISVRIRIVPPA